jgi:5-methyltetrahydropteroyltriglutamate--homocysteine methyltransferase
MKHSENRVLTTHTGSLPRPDTLKELMFAKLDGEQFDQAQLETEIREAVRQAVKQQVDAGIDVVCDGEMGREGMHYLRDHMDGFGGESKPFRARDIWDYPEVAQRLYEQLESLPHMRTPACTGAIEYRDRDWIQSEIETFRAALAGVAVEEAFITVTSPGTVAQLIDNQHYESREAYMFALADAIKVQCDAIAGAGFLVQMDACDLPMEFHVDFQDRTRREAHELLELNVEAINRSLADVPTESIRLHVCWGNYGGPHHHDVPLSEIMDLVLACRAGAYSFPAANPRHEHEWRAWENVSLAGGTVLIPGVIDTISPFIEHPQLVADRIERFAGIVGPQNVIASTDCGFGTFVGMSSVQPRIAWAKLVALAEGARLASTALFGQPAMEGVRP